MKIALFSDIHANRQAFSACLQHARAQGAEQFALLGQVADLLHHGHGLAAIADQVTQQRKLFGAVGAGVLQAGVQGLSVGVDVGQQGDFHGVVSSPIIARMAECQLAACASAWAESGNT